MVDKNKKRLLLKIMIKGVKDGKGGKGTSSGMNALYPKMARVATGAIKTTGSSMSEDNSAIAPYKNSYYRRAKAAQAFGRVAKTTGLDM